SGSAWGPDGPDLEGARMAMSEPGPEKRTVRRFERRGWMAAVPLLVVPLLAYVAFAGAGADFDAARFEVSLPSGGTWRIALGDILLAVGLGLLFFEVLKATRTGGRHGHRPCLFDDGVRGLPDLVPDLGRRRELDLFPAHADGDDRRDRGLLGHH